MSNVIQENENCEETHASFRICGDNLVPQQVNEHLRVTPSFACAKGDTFKSRAGLLRRPTGVWLLSSENKVRSTSLERHLTYLLGKLEIFGDEIRRFVEDDDYRVDFLCCWVSATGHGGPILSNGMLRRLAFLCDEVGFDYYGPYDDE